jgi:hypothetical protein
LSPPILLSIGYRGFYPREVKQKVREADHSHPSRTQVKNAESIPSLSRMPSWHAA